MKRNSGVHNEVRTLFSVGVLTARTDAWLLEQFLSQRGDAAEMAFEAQVRRHGPMVLRVCRDVLGDPHAVQDAFQATFLVLVPQGECYRRARAAEQLAVRGCPSHRPEGEGERRPAASTRTPSGGDGHGGRR